MYFTTPTLDFSTHAEALNHIIEELYQEYPGCQSTEKIFNINIVLYVFDLLTKLPTKKWINNNSINNTNTNTKISESIKQQNKKYIDKKNPIINIIRKYLSDFDIEKEKEWKIETENLKSQSSELHISQHTFDPTLSNKQKAYYYYLRGYLYNILDYYHYLAEKNLSMAVKLDPTLNEAWSELAECYLKKNLLKKKSKLNILHKDSTKIISNNNNNNNNDSNSNNKNNKKSYIYQNHIELILAKHCLERALNIKPNVKVLNNMALTLRKLKSTYSEYKVNIEKSIDLSKKAVSYDINNSSSWASIGISYLEYFFNISRNINDLRSSLKAYTIGISHCKKECCLDMLLNRYMINSYLENYQETLNDLKLINEYIKEKVFKNNLYPTLSLDHLYQENIQQINKLEQYLEKISSLIKNKCYIKDKVFLKITWGNENPFHNIIKHNNNNNILITNNDSNSKAENINIESSMISMLKLGKNPSKYIRLRVISEMTNIFGFNRSFIAVDEANQYISLSIYNLKNSVSLIGKEIIIYEPELFNIKIKLENNIFEYKTIRIDLYSQRSLQQHIEKEFINENDPVESSKDNHDISEIKLQQKTYNQYTLEDLKKLNLIIEQKFIDDLSDIEYSTIHFDYS